jgi:tetratricopeptide (TPR) repeat protein
MLRARLEQHGVVEHAHLDEVARRADGVPLAIELLAAQARTLPLDEIVASFDRHLLSATAPFADTSPRHRSLGAALEGSFLRLTEVERSCAHDLCVFRNVFTIADAEVLLARRVARRARPVLERLLDASFVTVDAARQRWRFLQPVRDFLLHRCGPHEGETRLAYALRFRDKAEQWGAALWTRECAGAAGWLEAQLLDGLAAYDVLRAAGRDQDALRLACGLDEFLAIRGPSALTLRLLDAGVLAEGATIDASLLAQATFCRGRALVLAGRRDEAEETLVRAEALFASRSASAGVARARAWRALASYWFSDLERASTRVAEALALADSAGSAPEIALASLCSGMFLGEQGRGEAAEECFARAARLIEEHGLTLLRPRLIVYRLYFLRGRTPRAEMIELLEEALSLTESVHDYRFAAGALTSLGDVAFLAGDAEAASTYYERAARRYEEVGFFTAVPLVRLPLGLTRWLAGEVAEARRLLVELAHEWGRPLPNRWVARVALAALRADLGEREDAERLFAECAAEVAGDEGAASRAATRFLELCRLLLETEPEVALAALARAKPWTEETPGSSSEIVLAYTLVERRLRSRFAPVVPATAAPEREREIELAADGSWFAVAGGPRVSIGRRPALRRLLLALRDAGPEGWLTAEAAFAAGWPGEKGIGRSASYRVYSAIKRLRALGLDEALETGPGGYRLRGVSA